MAESKDEDAGVVMERKKRRSSVRKNRRERTNWIDAGEMSWNTRQMGSAYWKSELGFLGRKQRRRREKLTPPVVVGLDAGRGLVI